MVYRFYCMALFQSQTRRHMIKMYIQKDCRSILLFLLLLNGPHHVLHGQIFKSVSIQLFLTSTSNFLKHFASRRHALTSSASQKLPIYLNLYQSILSYFMRLKVISELFQSHEYMYLYLKPPFHRTAIPL